jgi:ribose-phosphate pyrophosphokinase
MLGRGQVVKAPGFDPDIRRFDPYRPSHQNIFTDQKRITIMGNIIKIFSGNAHREMAKEIASHLGLPLSRADIKTFSDGEIFVEIKENVRGTDAFVVQPTCTPVNDHLMELVIMVDALRRASARRITAVVPYYGYARQDRKNAPRVPITAKVVAEMFMAVGVRRVLCMDLHAGQIQGFFNIPVDHLYAAPVMLKYIHENFKDVVMVSPDAGGVERTRAFAKRLNCELAIIDKRRDKPNECQAMNVIGDVAGKTAVLVDDMVDTAGTLCAGAQTLLDNGAKEVHACCSHPVLSGPAIERISSSNLKSLVVTNSIPLRPDAKKCGRIKVLSVSELLADAINRIHNEDSVSSLFV